MIPFFPPLYPDEALYDAFARYHELSGNTTGKKSTIYLFGKISYSNNYDFPIHLKNLCTRIGNIFNPEYLIFNHTIFPIYASFLPNNKIRSHIKEMIDGKTCSIGLKLDYSSNDAIKLKTFKICTKCFEKDIEKYKVGYLHRIHQIEGYYICHLHNEVLKKYTQSSCVFLWDFLNINNIKPMDYDNDLDISMSLKKELEYLAEDIAYVFENYECFPKYEDIIDKYSCRLKEKGYVGAKGFINQQGLAEDFKSFYSTKLLELLHSDINTWSKSNWVRTISTNIIRKDNIHPIRHLLFIRFLFGDVHNFCNYKNNYYPFGPPPWPCLNPISDHYMQKNISDFKYAITSKSTNAIGIFRCQCGFTYTKNMGKVTDKSDWSQGTFILEYGEVWNRKLSELIKTNDYGIRSLAKQMKCSVCKIKKFVVENGFQSYFSEKINWGEQGKRLEAINRIEVFDACRETILNYIKLNPNASRFTVQKECGREWKILYSHNKELLESVMPKPLKNVKQSKLRIDWDKRDEEFSILVEKSINNILAAEKPLQITIGKVSNIIGYKKLYRVLDKLPKTKDLIEHNVESMEQFWIRKIDYVFKELLKQNKKITRYRILYNTNISTCKSKEIIQYVDNLCSLLEEQYKSINYKEK